MCSLAIILFHTVKIIYNVILAKTERHLAQSAVTNSKEDRSVTILCLTVCRKVNFKY